MTVNSLSTKKKYDKILVNKSLIWENKIVNKDLFFSLFIKKLEFNTITNVQHKNVEKAKPTNDPSVLFSPLKYPSSLKNLINLLYSQEIKIEENKIGPINNYYIVMILN